MRKLVTTLSLGVMVAVSLSAPKVASQCSCDFHYEEGSDTYDGSGDECNPATPCCQCYAAHFKCTSRDPRFAVQHDICGHEIQQSCGDCGNNQYCGTEYDSSGREVGLMCKPYDPCDSGQATHRYCGTFFDVTTQRTVSCGSCTGLGQQCSTNGSHICLDTCASLAAGRCGNDFYDGRNTITCGCPSGQVCTSPAIQSGQCCTPTPKSIACSGHQCGTADNGCNGTWACGSSCTNGQVCNGTVCVTPPPKDVPLTGAGLLSGLSLFLAAIGLVAFRSRSGPLVAIMLALALQQLSGCSEASAESTNSFDPQIKGNHLCCGEVNKLCTVSSDRCSGFGASLHSGWVAARDANELTKVAGNDVMLHKELIRLGYLFPDGGRLGYLIRTSALPRLGVCLSNAGSEEPDYCLRISVPSGTGAEGLYLELPPDPHYDSFQLCYGDVARTNEMASTLFRYWGAKDVPNKGTCSALDPSVRATPSGSCCSAPVSLMTQSELKGGNTWKIAATNIVPGIPEPYWRDDGWDGRGCLTPECGSPGEK